MKIPLSTLAGFAAGIALCATLAFSHRSSAYDPRKSTAEVEQYQGVYVFSDCKPVCEYDYIGKVNAFWVMKNDYETIRDEIVRLVKKKHKEANAVIIHFSNDSFSGDAIKIKEPSKE